MKKMCLPQTVHWRIFIFSAILALTGLFFTSQLDAEIYKWVDEKGVIHYSDQPNKPNAEKFILRHNTTTTPRAIKTDEGTDEQKKTETTTAEPTEPVEKKRPAAEKRKLCNEAKSDIAAISSRGRMREVNAKGEFVYLSEKQRQQRISAAKKKQSKYCR